MHGRQDDENSKRVRAGSRKDANTVKIQFSPEILRDLSRLEAAVCESEHFDSGILECLQDLASGQVHSVQSSLMYIGHIVKEAMNHVRETGDKKAEAALDSFLYGLLEDPSKEKIIILNPSVRRR